MFTGEPNKIHINVAPAKPEGEEAEAAQAEAAKEEVKEKDPLASTEEEDPNAGFVPRNFTELDRLQFTVAAIENDCHIMPKGAVKMTDQHEIRKNNAFRGLSIDDAVRVENYSHFRSV